MAGLWKRGAGPASARPIYLIRRIGSRSKPADFNPATAEFLVELRSGGDLVYSGALESGAVPKVGHKWRYLDRGAAKGVAIRDGVFYMLMSPDRAGIWRWSFKAFTDMSTAVHPTIRVSLTIEGTVVYDREKSWTQRANGYIGELGRG